MSQWILTDVIVSRIAFIIIFLLSERYFSYIHTISYGRTWFGRRRKSCASKKKTPERQSLLGLLFVYNLPAGTENSFTPSATFQLAPASSPPRKICPPAWPDSLLDNFENLPLHKKIPNIFSRLSLQTFEFIHYNYYLIIPKSVEIWFSEII